MPCLLSTTAKTAFRGINPLHRTQKIVTSRSNTLRQYAATAHAKQEPAAQLPPNDAPLKPASTLTPAQTARAACKAVHIALKSPNTGLNRAFLIVNSLHFSNFRDDPKAEEHPLYQKFKDVAIKFDRPIPPGLASTALLHGLVRLGKTKDAGRLAVQMMAMGLHLKPKTLNLVHKHLLPKSNPGSWKKVKTFPFAPHFTPNPKSLSEIAPMAQNESTRLALDLFALAENHQHQTKRGMFATLLTICLINGEIILASLLLGYFVKDAHSRSISTANAKLTEPSVSSEDGELLHEPGSQFMVRNVDARRLLTVIDRTFARNPNSEDFHQTLQSALQSLANLASLLEHKTVIIPELSLLLRTLYHVPRVDNLVWVCDENGQPIQVEAYEYFHLVLRRVIERLPTARGRDLSITPQSPESLPTAQSGVPGQNNTNVSPDLHITVYNTLLHYSLRHQFSMTFAERILLHMIRGRESGPLSPPQEVFNIILRSGTLLQQPDVAQQAIAAYRSFYPHDVNTRLPPRRRRRTKASRTRAKERNENSAEQAMELMTTLARSRFIKSRHTRSRLLRVPEDFLPENYALSNLIVHVTSTGSPQAIQNLVVAMFPELFIPLLPRNHGRHRSVFTPSAGYDRNERIQARNRAAIRGITYGPHVFSALLNALRKAGRTRLAWAVWRLALISEKKSWKTQEPWLLHISAYDSMLKCLAQDMREESNTVRSGGRLKRLRRDRQSRRPENLEAGESKALGAAWRLYKSMKKKGPTVRRLFYQRGGSKQRWNEVEFGLQIPRPDARWFNTALELFILPTMRAKRSVDKAAGVTTEEASKSQSQAPLQRTPDEVWTEFDHLRRINIETGYVSQDWNKLFQVIAEDMVEAGYPVPPGLRYIFIGRWETGMLNTPAPVQLERTAYDDPWDDGGNKFSPYLHSARPDKSVALRKRFGLKESGSQDI